jgi:SAM-dependent methyltransferase
MRRSRGIRRLLRSNPALWRIARNVRTAANRHLPPRHIEGVDGPVHRNDTMMLDAGQGELYRSRAVATIDLFTDRVAAQGLVPDEARWFEIGCGYGRLVRVLVRRVPPANVVVCDIDPHASKFCADAFAVGRVASDASFALDPPVSADVVFALSVATHIPAAGFERFLDAGLGALRPGGVFLFTTHGEFSFSRIEAYDDGAFEPRRAELEASWREGGIAYAPYAYASDESYGMTWHRPDVVEAALRRRVGEAADIAHEPSAIDGHQDLWMVHLTTA